MNKNYLEGMRCPKCKSEGPFRISARAIFKVDDDGSDEFTCLQWDDEDQLDCCGCMHYGVVKDFKVAK